MILSVWNLNPKKFRFRRNLDFVCSVFGRWLQYGLQALNICSVSKKFGFQHIFGHNVWNLNFLLGFQAFMWNVWNMEIYFIDLLYIIVLPLRLRSLISILQFSFEILRTGRWFLRCRWKRSFRCFLRHRWSRYFATFAVFRTRLGLTFVLGVTQLPNKGWRRGFENLFWWFRFHFAEFCRFGSGLNRFLRFFDTDG